MTIRNSNITFPNPEMYKKVSSGISFIGRPSSNTNCVVAEASRPANMLKYCYQYTNSR